jgi:hypothetical protein
MERCLPALLLLVSGWGLLQIFSPANGTPGQAAAQEGSFATGNQPAAEPVQIDGKRAMGYLKEICDLGPRMSGTPSMKKQQDLIKAHFTKLGAEVEFQAFTAKQVSQPNEVDMANIIISFHPKAKKRVILCSHYDTRPIADQEKNPKDWNKPFVSANDGGSGVALLMELGNHIKKLKLDVGVDFVLFDGEEYIFNAKKDNYFFGSKHFALTWAKNGKQPQYVGAVLLDMIAGKHPQFPGEGYSYTRAKALTTTIWNIAAKQGCKAFLQHTGDYVRDDHIALLDAGIPAIDIIDFSYPHWHKLTDTPESCDPDGMDQVARVLSVWMQTVK